MKYKDAVVLMFLSGILLYAVCCRNNLIGKRLSGFPVCTETALITWQKSLFHRDIEIKADTVLGLSVKNAGGETLAEWPHIRAGWIRLHENLIWEGDTVDVLYSRLSASDSIPCFLIREDGTIETFNL